MYYVERLHAGELHLLGRDPNHFDQWPVSIAETETQTGQNGSKLVIDQIGRCRASGACVAQGIHSPFILSRKADLWRMVPTVNG
jgi:hypothetical protein